MVVAIDGREARVWPHGTDPGTRPERVVSPNHRDKHRHVRGDQLGNGQSNPTDESTYFDEVAHLLEDAGEILLIGHGHGKSNVPQAFTTFLSRRHNGLASRISGVLDSDLSALTDAQVLALARHWFDTHERP
jgi:pimeloyl-ACP methyl ester carboxylesterase